MDFLKDIPGWIASAAGIIGAIVGLTSWVNNALAKVKTKSNDDITSARHDLRTDIGKMSLQLEQDDLESERRTNRQIDDLKARIMRLEHRMDEMSSGRRPGSD